MQIFTIFQLLVMSESLFELVCYFACIHILKTYIYVMPGSKVSTAFTAFYAQEALATGDSAQIL